MAQLTRLLRKSLVFPFLKDGDKASVLRQMVQGIAAEFTNLDEHEIYAVIMEREQLSSTGIGSGIAIPHAKMPRCAEHVVAFGRSRVGIPFEAIDDKPVHLIFLILGPTNANEAHLKILARISKFLHDTNFRDRLITAPDAAEIYDAIAEKDAQFG